MKTYHDIAGDGGSNVSGQVLEQRARIARGLEDVRHVVAVGSGKGGVGKSTLTTAIAALLRARGLEIAILDADFNGPSQARLAGLTNAALVPGRGTLLLPHTRSGIGVFSLGSVVPAGEAFHLESVASGESHTWRATKEFALLGEVLGTVAWGPRDVLLVDLPPGSERTVQYAEFLGPGASFVLVTIPSDLSREVVGRSVAALRRTPNPLLGHLVNMSGYSCPSCGEIRPLFPAADDLELDIPCLGRVPFDPDLARSRDLEAAVSLRADSPTARALAEAASRLLARLEEAAS